MVKSAWDQVVAGPFGGREIKNWGFDFEKAIRPEIFVPAAHDFGADAKIVQKARAAKVQITILEARFLEGIGLVSDDERGEVRFANDFERMEGDLDLPGLERGVWDILLLDDASSFHDIFVADVGED